MIIRELNKAELLKAVYIKASCYEFDFGDLVESLDVEMEYKFVSEWVSDKNAQDIRKIYGAFIDQELVGYVGASFAEIEDAKKGVEINYLFVDNKYRLLAIGLKLIRTILVEFRHYGVNEVIVYSYHESESNKYYRYLGASLLKQINQPYKDKHNLVDVFKWNRLELIGLIQEKLNNRNFERGGFQVEQKLNENVYMTSSSSDDDYNTACISLLDYNVINTNGVLRKPGLDINLYLKHQDKTIGAILCDCFNYSMYIDVMWIDEAYRGNGYGKDLIYKAEQIAKENGCLFAHTSTYNFQSPLFYQACGYEIFAKLDDFPNGIIQYFLKKKL